MQMTQGKMLSLSIIALILLVIVEIIISLFVVPLKVSYDPAELPYGVEYDFTYTSIILPVGVPADTLFAALTPIGSSYLISEHIYEWIGISDDWNFTLYDYLYEPLMRPCVTELGIRTALQDFAKHTLAKRSFDNGYYAWGIIERGCFLYLFIWVFLGHWIYLFIRNLKGAKDNKWARAVMLIAVLLSPTLWSELIFLVTGVLEPGFSYAIAYVLFLGLYAFFSSAMKEKEQE